MGYADLATAAINVLPEGTEPDDALMDRLAAIDDEISRTIDLKCGRSFGGTAVEETRAVEPSGDVLLYLPTPIRSISAVAITGTIPETLVVGDGTSTTHQVTRAVATVNGEWRALRRIDGATFPFPGLGWQQVEVTAVWADTAPGGTVPSEIVAAATFIVADEWRLRQSSPSGEIGPDGMTVRPRNPWKFTLVEEAIAKWRVAKVPVF